MEKLYLDLNGNVPSMPHLVLNDQGGVARFAHESDAKRFLASSDLLELAKLALPIFRDEFLDLASKYAGTKFETDPVYLERKQRLEKCKAVIDAATAP